MFSLEAVGIVWVFPDSDPIRPFDRTSFMSDYDDFTFSQQELEELSAFEASVRSVPQAAPLAGEAVAVSRPSAIASTSKSMEEESATPSLAPAVVEFDLESSDLDGETTSSGLTSRRSLFHRFRMFVQARPNLSC